MHGTEQINSIGFRSYLPEKIVPGLTKNRMMEDCCNKRKCQDKEKESAPSLVI
jgi:hypothetical protein